MITLRDIVEAEKAKNTAGDAWYAAKTRSEDAALPIEERAVAAIEAMTLRPAHMAAYQRRDEMLAQAVREAGQ